MHGWTHAICDECWKAREPDRVPLRVKDESGFIVDECCFCGGLTQGIYVREDPKSSLITCDGRSTPLYAHDCTECVYLGDARVDDLHYDLYFCAKGPIPTVIARASSHPPDYVSGTALADYLPPLHEALCRARQRRLVEPAR